MEDAGVLRKLRYLVWQEAFKTATKLDGLVLIEIDGETKSCYELFTVKIRDSPTT